jgi:hypothetical protein
MDLVMFHSGKELPSYLEFTFKQIRTFNLDLHLHFITDEKHVGNYVFGKYDVNSYNKDLYYSNKVQELERLMGRKSGDFWMVTLSRLVYIETFIGIHNLKNVYHFENDVMLYYDLKEYEKTFKNNYIGLAITKGSSYKWMTGFAFIKDYIALSKMTQFFIFILQTHGVKGILKKYPIEMVHEMSLISLYNTYEPEQLISPPTLPSSWNFIDYNSIFDPAAWGQYVGGTTDGIPGAKPPDHDISQMLIKHPEYDVIWNKDNKGRKIPYFKIGDEHVRINNLHIHSKNLHLYLS